MSAWVAARRLNDRPPTGGRPFVLLWVQQAQRARGNPALEFAIKRANEIRLPVVAVFGLMETYPEADERHFAFLLEGLFELREALAERGIPLLLQPGDPADVAITWAGKAALTVCDRGYLRHQVAWRDRLARESGSLVWEVETDVCVPADQVSEREEFAARTIRPKIWKFLNPLPPLAEPIRLRARYRGNDLPDGWGASVDAMLRRMSLARTVRRTRFFKGGESEARQALEKFLKEKLADYPDAHSDPSRNGSSGLSPHLRFGQISALEIAHAVERADAPRAARDAFLEQLIVRRELSMNFVLRNPRYDRWEGLPEWARSNLEAHAKDRRETVYSEADLEQARTHDPYWNAAQLEMVRTGFMHNTMRMYWGKKILEWSASPWAAFRIALRLNHAWELDGRDPNGYAGVAWCFGKHDRPWTRRPVFGTIRYMNDKGLQRKYDIEAYVERVWRLEP